MYLGVCVCRSVFAEIVLCFLSNCSCSQLVGYILGQRRVFTLEQPVCSESVYY